MEVPKTIELETGVKALDFTPSHTEHQLAVISVDVLQYLAGLLPRASLREVVDSFITKSEDVHTIEEWVKLLSDEADFHASINMLREYFIKKERPQPAMH